MFKKVFLVIFSLIFALGILAASVYRTSAQTLDSNLQGETEESVVEEVNETTSSVVESKVDYQLVWPGILPDHFLYPLKMIRDRIWLFLTTDPLKKTNLLLNLADKRIWSAQLLLEKGEKDLAVTTATKAEKYLEQAVSQERVAQEKGKDTYALLERFSKATLKHEEVLLEIKGQLGESGQQITEETLRYSRQGREQIRERLGR